MNIPTCISSLARANTYTTTHKQESRNAKHIHRHTRHVTRLQGKNVVFKASNRSCLQSLLSDFCPYVTFWQAFVQLTIANTVSISHQHQWNFPRIQLSISSSLLASQQIWWKKPNWEVKVESFLDFYMIINDNIQSLSHALSHNSYFTQSCPATPLQYFRLLYFTSDPAGPSKTADAAPVVCTSFPSTCSSNIKQSLNLWRQWSNLVFLSLLLTRLQTWLICASKHNLN